MEKVDWYAVILYSSIMLLAGILCLLQGYYVGFEDGFRSGLESQDDYLRSLGFVVESFEDPCSPGVTDYDDAGEPVCRRMTSYEREVLW